MPIDKRKSRSEIIKELMDSWGKTGKIGSSSPETKEEALKQAEAVAYSSKKEMYDSYGNSKPVITGRKVPTVSAPSTPKEETSQPIWKCKDCGNINKDTNKRTCEKCRSTNMKDAIKTNESRIVKLKELVESAVIGFSPQAAMLIDDIGSSTPQYMLSKLRSGLSKRGCALEVTNEDNDSYFVNITKNHDVIKKVKLSKRKLLQGDISSEDLLR